MHVLTTKGVEFREIDRPWIRRRRQARQRSGGNTSVPQIFIGGTHIGGCDELLALDRAGNSILCSDLHEKCWHTFWESVKWRY